MLFRSNDTATTEIYTRRNTLSLHDALPIFPSAGTVLVRIAWSPWLSVLGATGGCVAPRGSWTQLTVNVPGTVRIGTSYARSPGSLCPGTREHNAQNPP